MSDLETLARHRDAILLAEAVGWLHDYRKCSDEHLRSHASNKSGGGLPRPELENRFSQLKGATLTLGGNTAPLLDLLNERTKPTLGFLGKWLARCHRSAHFDKQEPQGGKGEQPYPGTKISSPFGYERDVPGGLTQKLWTLPWGRLLGYSPGAREGMLRSIRDLFSQVGADTRRPINEVLLWEWGQTTAALYKAACAGALLGFSPTSEEQLRWRLLSVRVDGLSFLACAHRIADLLARVQLLRDAFDRVKELVEVEYPLGTEVYRDEDGVVLVVPGCEKTGCSLDLLAVRRSPGDPKTLREIILDEFGGHRGPGVGGECVPRVVLDAQPWWGQAPQKRGQAQQPDGDELPPVEQHIAEPAVMTSDPEWVRSQWRVVDEVCTVCGLRPQGPSSKARERSVCDVCEQRRVDRAKAWMGERAATIWIDEVADGTGRFALIVGRFDLARWLDGTLVQTLSVDDPADPKVPQKTADKLAKVPSFPRICRIWRTARSFWQEVLPTDGGADVSCSFGGQAVGRVGRRLDIRGVLRPERSGDTLGPFYAYELVLPCGVKLSAVWDPDAGRFITTENLVYTARLLRGDAPWGGIVPTGHEAQARAADEVRNAVGGVARIEVPAGYGAVSKAWGAVEVRSVEVLNDGYIPVIPVLAEPRTFMALVPASEALKIVKLVKAKYECEMGKVRNRLPLHLGVVFARRRTPLRAVLDAGRRMLCRAPLGGDDEPWEVERVATTGSLPACAQASAGGAMHFAETFAVVLTWDGRSVTWHVPLKMGDAQTDDVWYPYVYWKEDANGISDPSQCQRKRAFRGRRPTREGTEECWLVHVRELQPGDRVYFSPATFDFEWLDTTARHFEIAYDGRGRRYSRPTRPYLLDDLDRLEELWGLMELLTAAQRHQVVRTIEATREAWYGQNLQESLRDGVFRQFVADTLAGAEWPRNHRRDGWDALVSAGVCGELADLAELYMEILKKA